MVIMVMTTTLMVTKIIIMVSSLIYGTLVIGIFIRKILFFPPADEKVRLREVK